MVDTSWLLILFLLAVIVGLVIVWARRRRKRTEILEPCCGQCGYAVRGLPGFTCPECGSDLREVGIATPGMRVRSGPLLPVLVWTLLVLMLFPVSKAITFDMLPRRTSKTETCTLKRPKSQAYRQFVIKVVGFQTGGQFDLRNVLLTLAPSQGSVIRLDVGPDDLSYEYKDAQGQPVNSTAPLDLDAMLTWMSTAGVDVDDPLVREEANEVLQCVQFAATGIMSTYQFTFFQSRTRGSTAGGRPRSSEWLGRVGLAFWGVVWLMGVWRITRRRPSAAIADSAPT